MSVFKQNLEIAEHLNEQDPHAEYGITKFSDLSPEEFREIYLIKNFSSPKTLGHSYPVLSFNYTSSNLPTAYDWKSKGVVTAVYNQGQCGSCWAFSTTENVESMNAIATGSVKNLAMQQLVDCDVTTGDHGCNGGNPPIAFQYIIRNNGLDSLASYPYTGRNGQCKFNPSTVQARVASWGYISTNDNENAMGQYTYQYGPPSACVDAHQWQFYRGGVVTSNCGLQLDHCVQITGWQTMNNINVWNVRNSWGTDWGESGYIYLMRGSNICAIGSEVTSCKVK